MEDIMNVMKGPEMTLPSEGKMAFIQRENEIGKKKKSAAISHLLIKTK